jgi:hypothetical protein
MSTINPDVTRLVYTIVVSSGEGSQALPDGLANKFIQVVVLPPSNSATYEFYIKEGLDDMEIFRRKDTISGVYNELLAPSLPLFGNNVFHIENASVDGNYKVRLVYE